MVKKALCVGCNYPSKAFGLAGAVNDAFLIAGCLKEHHGFEPENVCVLHDVRPGQKKSVKVDPVRNPTRVNILQQLQWLVRNARPGDVLFFSFSGYGLQVDDLGGFEDDGFEEAILPTDFVDGRDGDYAVVAISDVHDILMSIPADCSVTVVMDCDHATSVIDVTGTLDGKLVNGLKFQNFCGLKVHTNKKVLASHDREVWQEERARTAKARPRFQPLMEIDNPRRGRLPTRPSMARSSPVALCFSAAGHGQTAMELILAADADGQRVQKQHGVLSYCLVQALAALQHDCTYLDLLQEVRKQARQVKEDFIPRLDQEVALTFSTPLTNPSRMRVLQAMKPQRAIMPYKKAPAAPLVVPPPPRGFIAGPTQPGSPGAAPQPPPQYHATGRDTPSMQPWGPPPPPPLSVQSTRATTFSELTAPPAAPAPVFESPSAQGQDMATHQLPPPPPTGRCHSGDAFAHYGRPEASPAWQPPAAAGKQRHGTAPPAPSRAFPLSFPEALAQPSLEHALGYGIGHGLGQVLGTQAPPWTAAQGVHGAFFQRR